MEDMKNITLALPEAVIAKIELLLQFQKRSWDSLAEELLIKYTDDWIRKLERLKEDHTVMQTVSKRGQITHEMTKVAYSVAKDVYEGKLTRTEGKQRINRLSRMGEGSAQDYITDFLAMMEGKCYVRTMSADSTDYFLRQIHADYGSERFMLAVEATEKHLAYYETVSGSASPKRVQLLKQLVSELM